MSKFYTLADNPIVTVTNNEVEFNESMSILSKAIQAKINLNDFGKILAIFSYQ